MDKLATSNAPTYTAPLSSRERMLLAGWERTRKTRLTRADLVAQWGASVASDIAKELVRKGVLRRLSPGVYWIVPMRAQSRPTAISAPIVVASILADEPYHLGGLWAFTHHHLTEQLYTSVIDAFVARRRTPRHLANAEVRFHVVRTTVLTRGTETTTLEGTPIKVSSPERTLLDALDYPDAVGGLRAGLNLVTPAIKKVDRAKLVLLASDISRVSTCQRLGVLLERGGATPRMLAPLKKRLRESRSVTSMLPDAKRHGHVNKAWRVVENDQ
jgi:predicted transcriptional regulator of viral defense system